MTRLLTQDEVAEMCRTTPAVLKHWRRSGKGPLGLRLSKGYVYAEEDVQEWLEEQRRAARRARDGRGRP